VRGGVPGKVIEGTDPVAEDSLRDWMDDATTQVRFDLVNGPVWELRCAPVLGGGVIISLTNSHAIADGAFLIRNVQAALAGTHPEIAALPPATMADDITDGAGQLLRMGKSAGSLARAGLRAIRTPKKSDVIPVTSMSVPFPGDADDEDTRFVAPLAVASMPTDRWLDTARRHGGSANTLFIAIVVGIIVGSGRANWDDTIRVSIPMTARTSDDDIRSNVTTGRSLDLPASMSRDHDLAGIKAVAKRMYIESAHTTSTFTLLQTFVQGMSDRMLLRLNRRAATPLALASNVGSLGAAFSGFGREARAGAIMMRPTTPGATRQRLIQLRGGLVASVNESGPTTNITLSGIDPIAFPDAQVLHEVLAAECARWSLQPTLW
jgi:hypothetical protein